MDIIGKKFKVDFGFDKAILFFESESRLSFTITEMEGQPKDEQESVDLIQLVELRPQLYLAFWKERNGNTVNQVQDYQNGIIYSNWTLPGSKTNHVKGTIEPA